MNPGWRSILHPSLEIGLEKKHRVWGQESQWREKSFGGYAKSGVFSLLKTKPQVFSSAFLHLFSPGKGKLLEQFGVRGLGRVCQMCKNAGESKKLREKKILF